MADFTGGNCAVKKKLNLSRNRRNKFFQFSYKTFLLIPVYILHHSFKSYMCVYEERCTSIWENIPNSEGDLSSKFPNGALL